MAYSRHLNIGDHSRKDLLSLNNDTLSSTLVTFVNIRVAVCARAVTLSTDDLSRYLKLFISIHTHACDLLRNGSRKWVTQAAWRRWEAHFDGASRIHIRQIYLQLRHHPRTPLFTSPTSSASAEEPRKEIVGVPAALFPRFVLLQSFLSVSIVDPPSFRIGENLVG